MATRKQSDETTIAVIGSQVNRIQSDVADIKDSLNHNYVTLDAFRPVQRIAYGSIALLTTVLLAFFAFILNYIGKK